MKFKTGCKGVKSIFHSLKRAKNGLPLQMAGLASNIGLSALAISDLNSIDRVIEFDVKFSIQIDSVNPSKIIPDGKDKQFTIKGIGFGETARITFTDEEGNEVVREPDSCNSQGTEVKVTIPGAFFPEDIKGPIDVTVHYPTDDSDGETTREDAVEVVEDGVDIVITSISPDQGAANASATIYGAGFNSNVTDNEATVGSSAAFITSASETR